MAYNNSLRKVWFKTLKEAVTAKVQKEIHGFIGIGIYRQKEGRHKGEYFVGTHIDFINRY